MVNFDQLEKENSKIFNFLTFSFRIFRQIGSEKFFIGVKKILENPKDFEIFDTVFFGTSLKF